MRSASHFRQPGRIVANVADRVGDGLRVVGVGCDAAALLRNDASGIGGCWRHHQGGAPSRKDRIDFARNNHTL